MQFVHRKKKQKTKFRKLYNINWVLCCDFLVYEFLVAEALALFSCCFSPTLSPVIWYSAT
jgi:hypothetical protein